jgi:hypothetical protein
MLTEFFRVVYLAVKIIVVLSGVVAVRVGVRRLIATA